ncbi:MAG: hypothetical protein GY697_03655 [Desulfobacterales bacterium]|nr:hypothetical protein [Desulfobacterales bacterium]
MRPLSIKLFVTTLAILILLLPACSSSQDASSDFVAWKPYSEGLQTASAQGKKAFLYFRADW